jgi:hypothetical protein
MSFSSLYKFVLSLKGRGHFLSPKEVEFLKNLLSEFSEEEIKRNLKRCFEELIPPLEKERSSLLRCKRLFEKKPRCSNAVYFNPRTVRNKNSIEILKNLPPERRREIISELKKLFGNKKPSKNEIEEVLKILLRLYS